MQLNVAPNRFWTDVGPHVAVTGKIKVKVSDFCVFEKDSQDTFLDPNALSESFNSVTDSDFKVIPRKDEAYEGDIGFFAGTYMEQTDRLSEIKILDEWISSFAHGKSYPSNQVTFKAPESKQKRKLIYDYMKKTFPFCKTEKSTEHENQLFVVTANTKLLPLLDAGLLLTDVKEIYLYLSEDPLTEKASKGICVGKGLDREIRTSVYKCLSKLCPLLDCKTIEDKEIGVKMRHLVEKL